MAFSVRPRITRAQADEHIGTSARTVDTWRKKAWLPPASGGDGRRVSFDADDFEAFMVEFNKGGDWRNVERKRLSDREPPVEGEILIDEPVTEKIAEALAINYMLATGRIAKPDVIDALRMAVRRDCSTAWTQLDFDTKQQEAESTLRRLRQMNDGTAPTGSCMGQ